MTTRDVLKQGPVYSRAMAHVPTAKQQAWQADTERRFRELAWAFEARRLNLRTANRRYARRNGLPLKGR
jgi:hypothetical protein